MQTTMRVLSHCQLARVSETNMRSWYLRKVIAAGGECRRGGGLLWAYSARPLSLPGSDHIVALPAFGSRRALSPIREMLHYFREREAAAFCTCGSATTPDAVRVELKAWGFHFLFAGLCMAVDLSCIRTLEPLAEGLQLRQLEPSLLQTLRDHPSFGSLDLAPARNTAEATLAMPQRFPGRAINLGFFAKGMLVATSSLLIAHGVAGIYDVAVSAEHRGHRLGLQIVAAACDQARALGMGYAVLQNSLHLRRFYEQLGFTVVSGIDHWGYSEEAARAELPSPTEQAQRRVMVDIGPEKLAAAVMVGDAELVRQRISSDPLLGSVKLAGAGDATALHLAAYHGNHAAVAELCNVTPDLESRDRSYNGTPLAWALIGAGPDGPPFKMQQVAAAQELLRAGAVLTPQLRRSLARLPEQAREAVRRAAHTATVKG